ncbi:MAG: PKD domain-containing protein [Bacillota bacterium]
MRQKTQASRGVSALASCARRDLALRCSIRPCIEHLEGRTLLSALPAQADAVAEPMFPAILAAESSSDVRAVIRGEGSIVQGVPYTVNLSATGSAVDSIRSWKIDWGDGQAETLEGNPSSASHTYGAVGNYTISAHATTGDGVEHEAGSAQLGTPVLVGNFSNPSVVFEFKGWKYFTADHYHPALWRTDGTAAGTTLITELKWDENSPVPMFVSSETTFYSLGDRLLFVMHGFGDEATHFPGYQYLWTTDGTAAGTRMLSGLADGSFSPIPFGDEIFYSTGYGYYRTDGVSVTKADFSAPNRSSDPHQLAGINNRFYYTRQGNLNNELWTSDGTAEGNILLRDDLPRGQLGEFIEVAGKTYFIYSPTDEYGLPHDSQLWTTDGTPQGTKMIAGGVGAGSVTQLLSVNGSLLYVLYSNSAPWQLWKSDGTAAGTVLLKDRCDSTPLVGSLDGAILFESYDAEHGKELWRTDGTVAGTELLKDLTAGAGSSSIYDGVRVGDKVYFREYATNSSEPMKLWGTDGTEAGTVSMPGAPVGVQDLRNSNDMLVFRAGDSLYAYESWKADGIVRLSDPTAIKVQYTSHVSTAGEMLFFNASDVASNKPGLWRLGGDGTQVVRVVTAVETSSTGQVTGEGSAYTLQLAYDGVAADHIESWTVRWGDGMVETIVGHPASITHTYADDGAYTITASASDGTHTYAAPDVVATIRNVLPSLTIRGDERVVVGRAYELSLGASDPGDDHIRSWTIDWGDGSVQTIEGNPSSVRHTYTAKGNYTITASVTDEDGISSKLYGASPTDSYPWNDPADAHEFTSPGGAHYYCKKSNEPDPILLIGPGEQWELWRDDGNGGEAVMLHKFYAYDPFYSPSYSDPLPLDRAPSHFMSIGDTIFFRAYDRSYGSELWATSDSATSAWLIKDLHPGSYEIRSTGRVLGYEPYGSVPDDLFEHNGKLYFIAGDGNEVTLWQTDGHEVTKADDILSKLGTNPTSVIVFNDLLILSTRDEQRRLELYQMDDAGAITPLLATHPNWVEVYKPKLVDGRIYFSAEEPVGSYNSKPWVITGGPVKVAVTEPLANITIRGRGTVVGGAAYTLNFGYGGLDLSSVRSVTIDWGDGHTETLEGHPASASHTYAGSGSYSISAYATAADGVHEAVSAKSNAAVLVGTFSNPSAVFEYRGLGYFTADDGDTVALWKTDGTAAGTQRVKALEPGSEGCRQFDSSATQFYNIGGHMVLLTMPRVGPASQPRETALWTSDGTEAGTTALDRFSNEILRLVALGNRAIYCADGCNKVTDGVTTAPADFLPESRDLVSYGMVANNTVYCTVRGNDGVELWKSDGTAAGTMLVAGGLPSGSVTGGVVEMDGKTYFGYMLSGESQVWATDGTPGGTSLVTSFSSPPVLGGLLVVNHHLLYITWSQESAASCWTTDGETPPTLLLGGGFNNMGNFVNGVMCFLSSGAEHGWELWSTDGTVAGTRQLTNLNPEYASYIVEAGEQLYLVGYSEPSHTVDTIWKADGIEGSIVSISGTPSSIERAQDSNGTLVCYGDGGLYVYEGGGTEGMVRVTDPGVVVDARSRLSSAGNMLFFTGRGSSGTELWRVGGEESQAVRVVSGVSVADNGQTTNEGAGHTLQLSYDAVDENSIRSWSIDWGDGRIETIEGHPSSVTHIYADDGNYTIGAKASDGGQTYVATDIEAAIRNVAPTLAISGGAMATTGKEYVLALGSSDPGQDAIKSWRIDWGDGRVETIKGNPSQVTHRYSKAGNFEILATATDEDGTFAAGSKVPVKVSQAKGTISGWVFNDVSGEGNWDRHEQGLAGWNVFIDSNDNGRRDRKEVGTVTDRRGRYVFDDVLPGTYRVAVSLPKGWRQSAPKGAVNVKVKADQIITQTFAVTQKVLPSKPVFHTGKGKTILESIRSRRDNG